MNFEILKGTKDYFPEEKILLNNILEVIKKNLEKYGFRPMDTPTIEFFKTLTYKYDPDAEIVDEIFRLKDRGNRDLGLRYDLTTGLIRFLSNNRQFKLPFRRYQVGNVFRDGPIKKGRLREFIQFDADVVGVEGQEIEVELMELFFKIFKELNLNVVIELNNYKILKGLLLQEGFKEEDLNSIILSIDKLKKIGKSGVLEEIKNKGFNEKKIENVLDILNLNDFNKLREISKSSMLDEGINELEKLAFYLRELKVDFRVNFSMARGLDIYTGNIWEVYDKTERISSSLGAGGRYDKKIGMYRGDNKEVPALGISFGIEPIKSLLEDKNEIKKTNTDILIVPLSINLFIDCFNLANKLRDEGKNVEIFYGKLKKGFEYSDYLGIKEIIIFGEKEKKEGFYTIKNLETKEEKKVSY